MKKVITFAIAFVMLLSITIPSFGSTCSEESMLYVTIEESSYLNVRRKPDRHSECVARLLNGDEIEVFEFDGNWIKTNCAGEYEFGWVSIDYLCDYPNFEPTEMRVTSNGRVRVRKTPGGEVARYVKSGKTVTVLRWINGWAKVKDGWIDGFYLSEIENAKEEKNNADH